MLYIGIDCGEHTGLAVWNTGTQVLEEVATMPLHRALVRVSELWEAFRPLGVRVVFEDARQRKWLPRERSAAEYRGKLMGAGAVKRDAKIWEEFLADNGIPFDAVPPRPGATKWSADTFAAVTRWTGRTSNHARDAALLVYGKR